jgi:L-seryl-tRNA(Ser) seleniumtransferase
MLSLTTKEIKERAENFLEQLAKDNGLFGISATLRPGQSAVGGGSGPNIHPETVLIAVRHETLSADEIERKLRLFSPPVIARVADGLVLLDMRTVDATEEPDLLTALRSLGS